MTCTVIDLNEERLMRSYDAIGNAIVDYINNMDLIWEVEIAKRLYFGQHTDFYDKGKSQNYKPFIQWLIFSYKLHNGLSFLDCIYEEDMNNMSRFEAETLTCLRKTQEGFYKVYSIDTDNNSILVKNIFTNSMAWVSDSLLVNNVKKYFGVFMRVVSLNNRLIPIPGYSVMSNLFLKDTTEYFIGRYQQYKKYNKEASVDTFISSNSLMIHRYFLNFYVH